MLKVLVLFVLSFQLATASLYSRFRHFEEIIPLSINIRHKRDIRNPRTHATLVQFDTLGKNFQLLLFPDNYLQRGSLEVHFVDALGKSTATEINTDGLYSGHEKNHPRNKVNAVYHDGEWFFHVETPEDIFVIEPISRLDPQRTGEKLIAYRSRDVLTNKSEDLSDKVPFCKASRDFHINEKDRSHSQRLKNVDDGKQQFSHETDTFPELTERNDFGNHEEEPNRRHRRASSDAADTCDIFVVVDYLTYAGVGRKSPDAIVKWIVHMFKSVDNIFRNSGLVVDGVTYGVMVKRIMIHKEFTEVSSESTHYNMKNRGKPWNEVETFSDFMRTKWNADYCLAHLISGRSFREVLSIATIASPRLDNPNGICMNDADHGGRNAGLTTSVDQKGNNLPLDTHIMTIAHVIAHGFGAEHDVILGECAHSSQEGGKYLMWPYPGRQRGRNARRFSPECSIPKLQAVMKTKALRCFHSRKYFQNICGDGIVGPDEDCDFGLFDELSKDKCCTSKCRFRPGAVCSPDHHPCCTKNCQVAPKTKSCVHDVANDCLQDSLCDGNDAFSCPKPTPKADGSPCGDTGTCWQGDCLTFCDNLGRKSSPPRKLESCNCDHNTTMMCRMCCLNSSADGQCVPMDGIRRDGSNCLRGMCNQGVCTPSGKLDVMMIQAPSDDSGSDDSSATIITFFMIGIVIAVASIVLVGTLFSGKKINKRPSSDDVAISELRKALEEAIGHLNVSPDNSQDPTTKAIKDQLEKEKKRNAKSEAKGKKDGEH